MKQQIKEYLYIDWVRELDGLTVPEAITWLLENTPVGCTLDSDYCDNSYLITTRCETDEEEAARIAEEEQFQKDRDIKAKLKAQSDAERMERLRVEDVVLHSYLVKHKGNPHIGDMENLFRAMIMLEREGQQGEAMAGLKECLKRLENNSQL